MSRAAPDPILLVSPWLKDGGIERMLEVALPWLVRRGHRVEVLSWLVADRLSGRPNPVLETFAAHGIRVRRLRAAGRLQLLQRAVQTAAIAARGRYRVIVGQELVGNVVAVAAGLLLAGRPRVIASIHNASNIHAALGTSPALLGLARRLHRRAHGIVAVSEEIRRDTIRFFGVDPRRVVTINNPFDLERIRELGAAVPSPDPRALEPFVVACGRFVEIKAFPDLIRAFAMTCAGAGWKLVILGDGPERPALVRCAEEAGVAADLILPGFVSNPFPYFRHARAFVLSSRSEAFSRVLVEAMACEVPIVSSRCEWGPEEVLDGGKYGELYEPGDIPGLAARLGRVLHDAGRAADLSRAARERAEDFSAEHILPRLAEYYLGAGRQR